MGSTLRAVSEPFQSDAPEGGDHGEESEIVDGLPVLVQEPTLLPATPVSGAIARSGATVLPAMQAAAVAAGGFVAGAAVVGLVNRRHRQSTAIAKPRGRRSLQRGGRPGAAGAELLQVVSSRKFLVDVHLLGPAPER
jgi:hypothetical protein